MLIVFVFDEWVLWIVVVVVVGVVFVFFGVVI